MSCRLICGPGNCQPAKGFARVLAVSALSNGYWLTRNVSAALSVTKQTHDVSLPRSNFPAFTTPNGAQHVNGKILSVSVRRYDHEQLLRTPVSKKMAAPLERISTVHNPVLPASHTTPEQRFWRAYKTPLLVKEHGAITHISFCPTSPYDFAVSSGARVQIFSAKTRQVVRTIARFKETAYSGEFRQDGKLVVAGDGSGIVQVFDAQSRAILVTLNPTSQATRVTKFHPKALSTLLSASDDKVLRLWDLTSSTPVSTFKSHGDYIRAASFLSPTSESVLTGCYDSMIRVYDPRTQDAPALSLSHGAPVEAVLPLTSTTVVSSGGPTIRVWDLVAGKMVKELSNFQKTVTSLYFGGSSGSPNGENAMLAGALDGHVKLIDTTNWEVKFGWKFGDGVLCTAISPNQKHFATGLTSGVLSIRTRKTEPRVKQHVKTEKSASFARMIRGADYKGENEQKIVIDESYTPRRKLAQFERHMNAFRWSEALDSAFVPGVAPERIVTVLEELRRRGKVRVSLSGRDEGQLEPLIKWAVRNIDDFRNIEILADWIACMIDMYIDVIEKSSVLEELLQDFRKKMQRQIEIAKDARQLEGMLEMLIQSH
ncbi:WD40-repeat-containing domain protein [Limtongia smithiae]|uniref:WD40-repeat-containing domain protein n=1 Tax=Limtongia smithiae TaxID=1125753 RepID=UPI0034D016B5